MKKILAMALSVAIIATLAISGTVAYFTDMDEAINVMTVGSVSIEQQEKERKATKSGASWTTSDLTNFKQTQEMYPVVYKNNGDKDRESFDINGYKLTATEELGLRSRDSVRNYIDKIVTVENTGKISDAYVRTILAVPTGGEEWTNVTNAGDNWLHWNGVSDTDTEKHNGWMWGIQGNDGQYIEWPGNNDTWDKVSGVEIDGIEYDLFIATNKNALKPGEKTAPNLLGFYLDCHVDNDDGQYVYRNGSTVKNIDNILDAEGNLTILVATQAVQTEGFDDAWDALDTAFGDITETNHPWFGRTDINAPRDAVEVSTEEQLVNALKQSGKFTIKLTEDIELTEQLVIRGNAVTLDMNGKTMSLKDGADESCDPMISVKNGVSLTIDGNGTFDLGANPGFSLMYPYGDVTINSGTFKIDSGLSSYGSFFVGISGGKGKLIINGGYFDGGYYVEGDCFNNCRNLLNGSWGQYVRVYGGTFVGQNPAWGDEGMAYLCTECEHTSTYCQTLFLEGQSRTDTELPAGYSITEGTTTDGTNRPTYTVTYTKSA